MRIGLGVRGPTPHLHSSADSPASATSRALPATAKLTLDEIVAQAKSMEADGFTSLWFSNSILGDPIVGMAVAGRETSRLELGVAVLRTYPCHPYLQATRAASVADAIGRGITVGIGPSHQELVEGMYGLSYDRPGRNTEDYAAILSGLLRGEAVDFDGEEWSTHTQPIDVAHPVSLLLSAMSPRLLRVAGELADGTITMLAQAKALETVIVPRITSAAAAAGRPAPRIVAGMPVAVHDDEGEARAACARLAAYYDSLPNYRRILAAGGYERTADAVIVGNKKSVKQQLQALLDAGATDLFLGMIAVGDDPEASRQRTMDTFRELLD